MCPAALADVLRRQLPGPDLLTPAERAGEQTTYQSHLLHVEPDGGFSILAVWRTGQVTPVHDHVTWCVVGVVQGLEQEELFACPTGEYLVRLGDNANPEGSVTGFAPPGDIHRVHNPGDRTTISLHVHGTDISRIGPRSGASTTCRSDRVTREPAGPHASYAGRVVKIAAAPAGRR
jgi:predicted metal-dependent enzyme (double-stranded beta helix superfamily)